MTIFRAKIFLIFNILQSERELLELFSATQFRNIFWLPFHPLGSPQDRKQIFFSKYSRRHIVYMQFEVLITNIIFIFRLH